MAQSFLNLAVDNVTASLSARIINRNNEYITSKSSNKRFIVIKILKILAEFLNEFVSEQKSY